MDIIISLQCDTVIAQLTLSQDFEVVTCEGTLYLPLFLKHLEDVVL